MNFMNKPVNCSCGPGGFRVHGGRWVVLERRSLPLSSKLKCLACGWKWWNNCQYVADLPDHVEDSRSGMTDEDILTRIGDGTISVLIHDDQPRVFSFSRNKWRELKIIRRESNGSEYSFVEITYQGKKKKIALHRLVWMFAHRRVVPDGYDIDHITGKSSDAISNLRLLTSTENRSRGMPELPSTKELPF